MCMTAIENLSENEMVHFGDDSFSLSPLGTIID